MSNTWLILDSDYLCHRARYALGGLSWDGEPTAIIFGFLRDVINLSNRFQTHNIVFTFDFGKSIRTQSYPEYKSNRKERSEEEIELSFAMKDQIRSLRDEYLPQLGFRNILYQKHFEADDIIASVCHNLPRRKDEAIIVSSDHDLFQLLSSRVSMFNPKTKELLTLPAFVKDWKLQPSEWINIKAMAGCTSDCIKGIVGVGEKSAAKFLRRELRETSKLYQKIASGSKVWQRNVPLVKLPFPGTEIFPLVEDEVSSAEWDKLCDQFGMNTLRGLAPRRRK